MACEPTSNGLNCPTQSDSSCSPFQLTKSNDNCFIVGAVEEALNIGGADINVFKLLGIHEQGKLIDLTDTGTSISGGDLVGSASANAFDTFVSEWRSLQTGTGVQLSSYIGFDFGELKLDNGRDRYGVETFVKHNIATIKIKQGDSVNNRATKARIERSPDGLTWYGVSIVSLPNDNQLNTISFNHSVPSRFWRIRPIDFNGSNGDFWAVQALQLIDYNSTSITDIQDPIFQENRDRDYAEESITLKGSYDILDIQLELVRAGVLLPTQFYIQIGFSSCVNRLSRPLVIGDILELPSETQYSPSMQPIKKYLEITDVGWSTEGFGPSWTPTLLRIIAKPMIASQETQDILGSINIPALDILDVNDGSHPIFQDISNATQSIEADANTAVPERGREGNNEIHEFTEDEIQSAKDQGIPNIQKIGLNHTALYVEDGLPPNGIDYTEGDTLPANPSEGNYHRLTYSGMASNVPPRLFRYSVASNRWIYLETDKRMKYNSAQPILQEFLSSPNAVPNNQVEKP